VVKINKHRREEMASDFVLPLILLKPTKVFVKKKTLKKMFSWVEFGLKIWVLGPIPWPISRQSGP